MANASLKAVSLFLGLFVGLFPCASVSAEDVSTWQEYASADCRGAETDSATNLLVFLDGPTVHDVAGFEIDGDFFKAAPVANPHQCTMNCFLNGAQLINAKDSGEIRVLNARAKGHFEMRVQIMRATGRPVQRHYFCRW